LKCLYSQHVNEVLWYILVSWELVTIRFKVEFSVTESCLCTRGIVFPEY